MISFSRACTRWYRKGGMLPSKHGNKDYYKGSRSGSMGQLTNHGAFILDENKIRNWMIPDLTGFPLKAYVSQTARKVNGAVKNVQQYIDASMNSSSK